MIAERNAADLAEELRSHLADLFPAFDQGCRLDELRDEMVVAPAHFVMRRFAENFPRFAATASLRNLERLAQLINKAVERDDFLENAISTCFLEHLRQIGAYKRLSPFLSGTAKRKTRP